MERAYQSIKNEIEYGVKMKTQICIVTGQPLANLIAILHFKPEQIIMVATNSMKVKSKEFKKILADLGIAEKLYTLDGCPDTDLQEINQFLATKLAEKLPQESCIFNLTGGTKLHSFSMYEVFKNRECQDQFIYVDTANRLLEYYPNKDKKSFNEVLPVVLDAKMTLKGMGKTFIKAESQSQERLDSVNRYAQLTQFIAKNIADENVKNLIGSLNTVIGNLYNGGKSFVFDKKQGELHQVPKGLAVDILEQAHDLGLIIWSSKKQIAFNNYEQARCLSGFWLEHYVYLVATDIGFDEIYSGLEFGSQQATNTANNEIDLFIQHQNIALAVECKSATSTKKSDISQDMFHKLTGVANRAGGLMCSKLFVSAFPLKTKSGQDTTSVFHAREQNIKIVQAQEIVLTLPQMLNKWKETGKL